jgi:hypothetical protein
MDLCFANDEIRLTLSSPKNEYISLLIENWVEKHFSVRIKVKFDIKYNEELLNDQECPLNGKLNATRRCSLPKWYPGYSGKFEIYCESQDDLDKIDGHYDSRRFKRILFGGKKIYEKYKEAGFTEEFLTINCMYAKNINKGSKWMFGEIYFFVDDFPKLCNNGLNGGICGKR